MKLFVAITDSDWFNYLAELRPDEVNFWKPSGSKSFHSLSAGEPLLFKLHSPDNFIVGGGFFAHYTVLPASFAWGAYREKNGANSEPEMRERIEKYRRRMRLPTNPVADYNGKEYYALQGKTILLPGNPAFRPSTEQLGWHNEHVYRP